MKIQLDFDNKIITLIEPIKVEDLIETLDKILPNPKEWEIHIDTKVNWINPIIIKETPYRPVPWWDQQPTITYDINSIGNDDMTARESFNHIQGTYQLEIK